MDLTEIFKRVKTASKSLALLTDEQRNEILMAVADAIVDYKERVLVANEKDLAKMDVKNPLYDRLQLTDKRLDDIAADMRNVASLRCDRHDLRGSSQCDLRRFLALFQER